MFLWNRRLSIPTLVPRSPYPGSIVTSSVDQYFGSEITRASIHSSLTKNVTHWSSSSISVVCLTLGQKYLWNKNSGTASVYFFHAKHRWPKLVLLLWRSAPTSTF